MYHRLIQNPRVSLPPIGNDEYVAHLYVIRSVERDSLQEFLKSQGVQTAVHYPIPDHRQPCFQNIYENLSLPVTERACSEVLSLPCYPEMTDDEVVKVATAVNSWGE